MRSAICLCLAFAASPLVAQEGASPARLAGLIETWRSTPEDVVAVCNRADPARAEMRSAMLAAWQRRNASLIARVDDQFAEVSRMLDPVTPPGADVPARFRRQLFEVRIRLLFGGKSPRELAGVCRYLSDPGHMMWSDDMIGVVEEAMAGLDKWKAAQQ